MQRKTKNTYMHRRICSHESQSVALQANEESQSFAAPLTDVVESREDFLRRVVCRRQVNHRDQDPEKSKYMDDQDHHLNRRKRSADKDVDNDAEKKRRPYQKSSMPPCFVENGVQPDQLQGQVGDKEAY